jgi:hypothetical protein
LNSTSAGHTLTRASPTYINARAEECYSAGMAGGEPAVRFDGEDYFVIGFYLARKASGERELYYVLRATDAYGNGLHLLERNISRATR